MGYQEFLILRTRKQFWKAINRKFYVPILQNNFFLAIQRQQHTTVCHFLRSPHTYTHTHTHTHTGPFRIARKICVRPFQAFFGIEPSLHRTNLHSTNIRHQLHTHFLSAVHLLLLTLREHVAGYGEIGSFTTLLLVFTGLIGLSATGKGPRLLFSFRCSPCLSQRDLRQFSFLPVSVRCTPHFLSIATVYGQTDMIFAALHQVQKTSLRLCLVLIQKAVVSDLQN